MSDSKNTAEYLEKTSIKGLKFLGIEIRSFRVFTKTANVLKDILAAAIP